MVYSCLFSQENNLLGSYVLAVPHVYNKLELLNANTFHYTELYFFCDLTERETNVSGIYKYANNEVTIIPTKIYIKQSLWNEEESRLEEIYDTIQIINTIWKEVFNLDSIYSYIEWGEKSYLLSLIEEDFEYFSINYNAGYEPKYSDRYLTKGKTRNKSKWDKSQIPEKYRNDFKENDLEIKVLAVLKNSEEGTEYKLNKGTQDGLKNDVLLYNRNDSRAILITKIEENCSYGILESIYFPFLIEEDNYNEIPIGSKFYEKVKKRKLR